jgi:wyosine [tRNA(Phe)-imidazoG37] synthetase (radical SAM superfamily)
MEFPKKTPEYEELKELGGPWDIVYGPLPSRRLGESLGVNLLGPSEKICSFDCPYCELGLTKLKMSHIKKGATYPTLDQIESSLRQRIVSLTKEKKLINHITISGNGEPTLHPDFLEAVVLIKKIRDELSPDSHIAVLSNGANLDDSRIVKALGLLDERIIKMDAGNDEMLKKIGSPLVRVTVAKLIQGIKKLKDVKIQSMFLQGAIDNTIPSEVEDWIEVIGIIKPQVVQLYSLDRVPATVGLKQVPTQRLKEISQSLLKRTGVKGVVFS